MEWPTWVFSGIGATVISWIGAWLKTTFSTRPKEPKSLAAENPPQTTDFEHTSQSATEPLSELASEAAVSEPASQLNFVRPLDRRLITTNAGPVVFRKDESGAESLVLIVSNNAAPVRHVTAEIIFRNGEQEVCGGTGTWVNAFQNWVDFGPAQRQELVVAVRVQDGRAHAVMNNRRTALPTRPVRAFIQALERAAPLEYRVLPMKALSVHVALLDSDGVRLQNAVFDYGETPNGWTLDVR